jgi:P pilus assembly chaperone PapD
MNTIYNEIAEEFGSSALSVNNPTTYALTLRQCQILLNKYGMEKASVIAKRYVALQKVGK